MDLAADNVSFTPYPDTSPEWVADQLRSAATVWVSCDSVSMMFEALTAGAAVGLITVPVRRHDRITAIAADLCARKLVTSVDDWRNGEALTGGERLAEARRCAALIAERWFA
jgi:mitochondrial fission protein ELM1